MPESEVVNHEFGALEYSVFGAAIGRAVSGMEALRGIYLPHGLDATVADSIAWRFDSLNTRDQADSPIVLRYWDANEQGEPIQSRLGVRYFDRNEIIELRHGRRLIVADTGSVASLETLKSTFSVLLNEDFPAGLPEVLSTSQRVDLSLAGLARAIVDELCATVVDNVEEASSAHARFVGAIQYCLAFLRAAYELSSREGNDRGDWNCNWFVHVDQGLLTLARFLLGREAVDLAEPRPLVFASFGLPQPDSKSATSDIGGSGWRYRAANTERAFVERIRTDWASEDDVLGTIARMEIPEGAPSIEAVGWGGLDKRRPNCMTSIWLFAGQGRDRAGYVDAFVTLTEGQFFGVPASTAPVLRMALPDAQGKPGSGAAGKLTNPTINALELMLVDSEPWLKTDIWIGVEVVSYNVQPSVLRDVMRDTALEVRNGNPRSPYSFRRTGDVVAGDSNGRSVLWFATEVFLRETSPAKAFDWPGKPVRVTVSLPRGDSLSGLIDEDAQATVVLAPPQLGYLIAEQFQLGSRPRPSAPVVLAPSEISIDGSLAASGDPPIVSVSGGSDSAVSLACLSDALSGAGVEQGERRVVSSHDHGNAVLVKGIDFPIEAHAGAGKGHRSPLVAAAMDVSVDPSSLPLADMESLRGQVELAYVRLLDADVNALRNTLGHVLLPDFDQSADVADLVTAVEVPALVPRAVAANLAGWQVAAVPTALTESAEASRFWEAFEALDVASLVKIADRPGQGKSKRIPSQVALYGALEPEAIDAYGVAYLELVEKAKDLARLGIADGRMGLFWATYPFATSVWINRGGFLKSRAVLLSPLHPIRLRWLFAAEGVLREASPALKRNLAGIVEGWSLPAIGPAEDNGRMVAVPLDGGTDQAFLGWSLLARASLEGPTPIELPEFAGNRRMPGSSTSGLNSYGVRRAISDYRRAFPHVSTLTVDLAATTPTSRLAELDEAVLDEALAASTSGSQLVGGVRVFDSIFRLGPIPDLGRRGWNDDEHQRPPLVWQRYRPGSSDEIPPVDVRIFQDSGAGIAVESNGAGDERNAGVLTPGGIRRLEARSGIDAGMHHSGNRPGLGSENETPLAALVNAVETDEHGAWFRVISNLSPAFAEQRSPRWTIAGESALHPSLIAGLLDQAQADLTLWEWRPPFLDGSKGGGPRLDRRPYIALTRVSQILRDQIAQCLSGVAALASDESMPGRILKALGAHGVGLSGMLARKDKQIVGAIGFALVLELAANASLAETNPTSWDFVFPIDVCDSYLAAMTDDDAPRGRRADLMLIRLHESGLVEMAPVEIKVRHLAAPVAGFPAPSDQTLRDAAEQLDETVSLLTSIVGTIQRTRSGEDPVFAADAALLAAALGALLDATISLSPGALHDHAALRVALHRAVSRVVDTSAPEPSVVVGRPLVAYLTNGASSRDGEPVELRIGLNRASIAGVEGLEPDGTAAPTSQSQLLISVGELAASLWGGGDLSRFAVAWRQAVAWAFARDASDDGDSDDFDIQGQIGVDVRRVCAEDAAAVEFQPTPQTGAGTVRLADEQASGPASPEVAAPEVPGVDVGLNDGSGSLRDGVSDIVDGGIRFPVGEYLSTKGHVFAEFWPANTALNQLNVGVVGDLGTGKTELIKALILQIRRMAQTRQGNAVSMLILDYKGDYRGSDFLDRVGGVAVGHTPIPLNVLHLQEGYTPQAAFRKAAMFADVIKRIYGGVGPVQVSHLKDSIKQLFAESGGEAPTLLDVYERYLQVAGGPDAVSAILENFTHGGWFETDPSKLRTFEELIRDRVLVVSLDHPDLDGAAKNAIVALFLNLYRSYMLALPQWPFEGNDPQLRRINSYLLIDEAHHIMPYEFEALGHVLLQGRMFGVGTILSSQFLSHFKTRGTDYREPLLTWFIHKVPRLTVNELAQLGCPDAVAQTIDEVMTLGVSQSFYRSLHSEGRLINETPYWKIVENGATET